MTVGINPIRYTPLPGAPLASPKANRNRFRKRNERGGGAGDFPSPLLGPTGGALWKLNLNSPPDMPKRAVESGLRSFCDSQQLSRAAASCRTHMDQLLDPDSDDMAASMIDCQEWCFDEGWVSHSRSKSSGP